MTARERRINLSCEWALLLIVHCRVVSLKTINKLSRKPDSSDYIYVYIGEYTCKHTNIHVCYNNKEKSGDGHFESVRGSWEGFKGG